MKEKSEIKQKLVRGDRYTIATVTGFSYIYVKKVLAFERSNEDIWRAAKNLVENRDLLKKQFKKLEEQQ